MVGGAGIIQRSLSWVRHGGRSRRTRQSYSHSGSRDRKLMFTLAFPSGLFHDSRPENGVAYI